MKDKGVTWMWFGFMIVWLAWTDKVIINAAM
jgi:hypothetical protein